MAKYLVETYYTCSFKVSHYLDDINEENLNKLGDNDFLKLRRSNALPAIYAHLASLPQADRLAQFRRDGVGEVPQATN